MPITQLARLRSLISAKLGRCSRCIQRALLGTIAAWIVAAGGYVSGSGIALLLTVSVASAFSLLFAAHLGAMVAREMRVRRRFRRVVSSPRAIAASPERRRFFAVSLKAVTAAAAILMVDFGAGVRVASAQAARLMRLYPRLLSPCNCYYSENCQETGRGNKCKYVWTGVSCLIVPKPHTKINDVYICGEIPGNPQCDGLCTVKPIRPINWEEVIPFEVAQAADLYFRAYLRAGVRGGGPPDRALVRRAGDLQLPINWHLELIDAVHGALDVTLGWDFMPCTERNTCFGHVPRLEETAAALVDAAREGFVAGLLDNDPGAVEAPLRSFWSRTEAFVPMHGGRCYPHGHPDAHDEPTCQIEELKADLRLLLTGRTPARVL